MKLMNYGKGKLRGTVQSRQLTRSRMTRGNSPNMESSARDLHVCQFRRLAEFLSNLFPMVSSTSPHILYIDLFSFDDKLVSVANMSIKDHWKLRSVKRLNERSS